MSIVTPKTSQISDNIVAQLESSFNQTIPLLPKAFNRVLAKVLAGVFVLLYKYGGFIFLQMFVSNASAQPTTINGRIIRPLIEWGRLIGIGDPDPGLASELTIQISVENITGETLQSGAQLTNSANGVTYITTAPILLDAAAVEVNILAVSDPSGGNGVGSIGNLDIGDTVSFVNPLSNVARDTLVTAQVVTGANAETVESYRQRVVDRWQKLPQGGAYADYELWGEEVSGIINVYPYTGAPMQVNVYAEATVESSGDPDGIPTAAQLTAVEDSIQFNEDGLASRRPVGAFVNVLAITRTSFDVAVTNLVVDNQAQIETEITSAIENFFLNAEPFIDGLSILPRKDRITRSALIGLVDDIVSAANGTFETVTFEETASPGSLELYTLGEGEKSKAANVTFDTVTS